MEPWIDNNLYIPFCRILAEEKIPCAFRQAGNGVGQSCQIQGMALDHFVFPKQPVVSADRCPTYVCPILPAAVSSRLMALPFSLNYDGNVHPLLPLPSPISRPSLSTRCTREPIRFTFLPSPPLGSRANESTIA